LRSQTPDLAGPVSGQLVGIGHAVKSANSQFPFGPVEDVFIDDLFGPPVGVKQGNRAGLAGVEQI
jgi:hypothetical protein